MHHDSKTLTKQCVNHFVHMFAQGYMFGPNARWMGKKKDDRDKLRRNYVVQMQWVKALYKQQYKEYPRWPTNDWSKL